MYDNLNNILIPRRLEDRKERYKILIQRRIQQYIKNGCIGNLDLTNSSFEKLPDNLIKVGGYLRLSETPIKSLGNLKSVSYSLWLVDTPIESLGNLESVGGALFIFNTPLALKYTKDEIRSMVDIKGTIFTTYKYPLP